ncbi:hypothetical protein G6F57_021404 [Rhizopus arrhizus]|nr:hypothetical protein G6F61_014599 [Rhizopus arrhizus]KAG1434826.1 hypothetical protein G6F57_021404 [Rhizopus arrhizus]
MPDSIMKFSMFTWPSDPTPGDAKLYRSAGAFLAKATNSAMFLAGRFGLIARMLGTASTFATGTKSLTGS